MILYDPLLRFKWKSIRLALGITLVGQKIPNSVTNNSNIWFLTHKALSDQEY